MKIRTTTSVIPKLLAFRKLHPQAVLLKKERLRPRDEPLAVLREEMAKAEGEPEPPSCALTKWVSSLKPHIDDLAEIVGRYLVDPETSANIKKLVVPKDTAQKLADVFCELFHYDPLGPGLVVNSGEKTLINPRNICFQLSQHFRKIATKDDSLKS